MCDNCNIQQLRLHFYIKDISSNRLSKIDSNIQFKKKMFLSLVLDRENTDKFYILYHFLDLQQFSSLYNIGTVKTINIYLIYIVIITIFGAKLHIENCL